MESPSGHNILQSQIYHDPKATFRAAMGGLNLPGELKARWQEYLVPFLEGQANPKDPSHQEKMDGILKELVKVGRKEPRLKEKAGLLFNIHRTLTQFRGYDPSADASDDVEDCFHQTLEIPDKGVIVVDHFVTRNLPRVLQYCAKRGVDLSRIRVRVPKAILAAQLMGMSDAKRAEFDEACHVLNEDQFLVEDVDHVHDISIKEKIAVLFSPRTLPIYPRFHAETEDQTVNNYRGWIKDRVKQLVKGGRMYINQAKVDDFAPLDVERTDKGLTKLTNTVSKRVAQAMMEECDKNGAAIEEGYEFKLPEDYDHSKIVQRFHAKKTGFLERRILGAKRFIKKYIPFF